MHGSSMMIHEFASKDFFLFWFKPNFSWYKKKLLGLSKKALYIKQQNSRLKKKYFLAAKRFLFSVRDTWFIIKISRRTQLALRKSWNKLQTKMRFILITGNLNFSVIRSIFTPYVGQIAHCDGFGRLLYWRMFFSRLVLFKVLTTCNSWVEAANLMMRYFHTVETVTVRKIWLT